MPNLASTLPRLRLGYTDSFEATLPALPESLCLLREDLEHADATVHVMRRIERVRYSSTLDPTNFCSVIIKWSLFQISRSLILRDRVRQLLPLRVVRPNVAHDPRVSRKPPQRSWSRKIRNPRPRLGR